MSGLPISQTLLDIPTSILPTLSHTVPGSKRAPAGATHHWSSLISDFACTGAGLRQELLEAAGRPERQALGPDPAGATPHAVHLHHHILVKSGTSNPLPSSGLSYPLDTSGEPVTTGAEEAGDLEAHRDASYK